MQLDRHEAIPLWRQIATALRYRVASGQLRPGERLPSLREAEGLWGVSLHTVRRAYLVLEREGLLELGEKRCARVAQGAQEISAAAAHPQSLQEFAAEVVRTARMRYGLGADELSHIIGAQARTGSHGLWVVECTATLAARLAQQVEARLGVAATPLTLAQLDPLPDGVLVGTYYHYAEITRAAAERDPAPVFLPVEIDAACLGRIRGFGSDRVILCGPDPESLLAMAGDLRLALGEAIRVEPRRTRAPAQALRNVPPSVPVVLSPESWEALPERDRTAPHAVPHASRFTEEALEHLQAVLHLSRGVPQR